MTAPKLSHPFDRAVEIMGEALHDFSDSVRSSGMLMSDQAHRRYEAVVGAWSDLTDELTGFAKHADETLTKMEEIVSELLLNQARENFLNTMGETVDLSHLDKEGA